MQDKRLNNAEIACFGKVAIYDYEVHDEEKDIWNGKVLPDRHSTIPPSTIVYFSRKYDKESDIDRMLHEQEILDDKIIGVPFLLVPKEKVLFIHQPHSAIARPPMKIKSRLGEH